MLATALTAEQVQLHSTNLADVANFRVFPIIAETVLYSIFTVLIVTSSYILITRGLRSRSSKLMLAVTLAMYALSSWDWAVDVHLLRDDLKLFLQADLVQPPPDLGKQTQINAGLHVSQAITNNICAMLSDMVVCWRVYVVYGRTKRILYMACAQLTALFAALLMCNLIQIGEAFPTVVHLHVLGPGELGVDIVALSLSALVNIWATAMIAYRAWLCRQQITRHFKGTNRRTFAESMLALFAETGAVYTLLWIFKNIIIIPNVEGSAYTYYATVLFYQITGMYPTLLVILVALKRSHLENQFTYHASTGHNTSAEKEVRFRTGGSGSAWGPSRFNASSGLNIVVSSDVLISGDSKTEVESKEEI